MDIREEGPFCAYFHHAIELIGSRWTGAIVRALLSGIVHFSAIAAVIPGLSDRMLSERLKELEHEGIVDRRVIPTTPVRVEYHLTEKGLALADVMQSVADWANVWTKDTAPAPANTEVPAPATV